MTFLEKLADLLTGGELSVLRASKERLIVCVEDMRHDLRKSYSNEDRLQAANNNQRVSLSAIAALETKHANATVRKMAKIAREALGK